MEDLSFFTDERLDEFRSLPPRSRAIIINNLQRLLKALYFLHKVELERQENKGD